MYSLSEYQKKKHPVYFLNARTKYNNLVIRHTTMCLKKKDKNKKHKRLIQVR